VSSFPHSLLNISSYHSIEISLTQQKDIWTKLEWKTKSYRNIFHFVPPSYFLSFCDAARLGRILLKETEGRKT
jgi:hypothetical protein